MASLEEADLAPAFMLPPAASERCAESLLDLLSTLAANFSRTA